MPAVTTTNLALINYLILKPLLIVEDTRIQLVGVSYSRKLRIELLNLEKILIFRLLILGFSTHSDYLIVDLSCRI